MKRIAIVGLGLVGGSIALGLQRAGANVQIVGVDVPELIRRPEMARLAPELHPVSELERALDGAELAILAAPVRAIESSVVAALAHADVVTDCGSTKRSIVSAAEPSARFARFVPGHPMAGGAEGGADHARADLFEGKRWLLCPERSDPDARARVERLIRSLGAEPVALDAATHDAAVALTSHVPQLLAAALSALAAERGALGAAGPSFAAATRSASTNAAMWGDIFETNADAIASALSALGGELESVAEGLRQSPADLAPALALLRRGSAKRHS